MLRVFDYSKFRLAVNSRDILFMDKDLIAISFRVRASYLDLEELNLIGSSCKVQVTTKDGYAATADSYHLVLNLEFHTQLY